MKILEDGHGYSLDNVEHGKQYLHFVLRVQLNEPEGYPLKTGLQTIHDGTTNEEVLLVLIDRLKYLNNALPCLENENAIEHLELALASLKHRTSLRMYRGVEGTNQP